MKVMEGKAKKILAKQSQTCLVCVQETRQYNSDE